MMPPVSPGATSLPVAFVAHGAPMLALDAAKGAELRRWAEAMPRPRSILAISPHWQTRDATIGATTQLPLLYDFTGFDRALYDVKYPYTPAPELATRVEELLAPSAPVVRDASRKLDHGVWVPLLHMYPAADVPVVQLSLPRRSPEELFALGKRLAPLHDEGTLILTSGNVTHNLRRVDFAGTGATPSWARDFDAWVADVLARGDFDALLAFRVRAPGASVAHPTDEHFLPLMVAAGAASARFRRATFPVPDVEGELFEYASLSRRCIQLETG
jgi:4,5-DOPA dioxygenase extradiol